MQIINNTLTKSMLLLIALSVSQSARANLLTNGSFESGAFAPPSNGTQSLPIGSSTITGWTITNDVVSWIASANAWSLGASDGTLFLDLTDYSAGAPFAELTQTIATVPGQAYALSFDLGSSVVWGKETAILASAAGKSKLFTSPTPVSNSEWNHVSMPFIATSPTTTISLAGFSGNNYLGLDNVSVDAIASPAPIVNTGQIINIQGYGDGLTTGSGANIDTYPVAPGTLVTLQNPVLVDFAAGDYLLSDAWGQSGALYDTWNFQSSAAGSWGSHYVVATPDKDGKYKILLDVVTNKEPTCKNHFCAWDTQAQARDAFLATAAAKMHLDNPTTVAFASADDYLPDNLGGISIQVESSTPANQAPVANAGPDQSGVATCTFSLDGNASSDPEGATLIYTWAQSSGPVVVLSNANSKNPSFTPSAAGDYSFSLIVNDGSLNSLADLVNVTVSKAPVITADAGTDRSAAIGDIVKLLGSAINSKGNKKLKYIWHQVSGPQVWSRDKKVKNTTFTPRLPGTYSFSLVAYDNVDTSNTALVNITVNPSITLTSPTSSTVWQANKTAIVNWTRSGINSKMKLAIIGSKDGGATRYYINKSVSAARVAYALKIKPTWKTNNAYLAICLMHPTVKNTALVCGQTQGFIIY